MKVPRRKISPRARVKRHENGRNYIVIEPEETLAQIAKMYNFPMHKLKSYNDLEKGATLIPGQLLFFGKKKNKGKQHFYRVKKGDTPYLISQKTGIRLNKLLKRNRMSKNDTVKEGEIIYLRGRKPKKR